MRDGRGRVFVVAVLLAVLAGCGGDATDESQTSTASVTTSPTPTQPVWSPVQKRGTSVVSEQTWQDPDDTSVDWIDVKRFRTYGFRGQPNDEFYWQIHLAAQPPLAADLEPGRLIAYGLVLETNGDGVADYLVGIDNDAPVRGDFHVWVTDLATGETDEQIGPPYGLPIEFAHPDERGMGPTMVFSFLGGTAPADLNPNTVRFYAWASETRDGEVIAWDTAPDTRWMEGP